MFEAISPFSRDLDAIREELSGVLNYDRTNYMAMLSGVSTAVYDTWGNTVPVQILLVTDGSGGFGHGCLKDAVNSAKPFPFPAKMNIITLSNVFLSGLILPTLCLS